MTQLTINIEDTSILPQLKKMLRTFEGVSIARPVRKKKTGLEMALEDIEAGRVTYYDSAEDMFKKLGI